MQTEEATLCFPHDAPLQCAGRGGPYHHDDKSEKSENERENSGENDGEKEADRYQKKAPEYPGEEDRENE